MKPLLLPAIALLAASGAAQQCCPTANLGCTTGFSNGNSNVFALILPKCSSTTVILGLTIKTQSNPSGNQTIKFHFHLADNQTPPRPVITPVKSGTMVVGPSYGLYSGTLSSPLVIPANTQYYVAWETAGMRHPICSSGGTPTSYWWHPPSATTWNGTFTHNWAYRVDTAGCPAVASYKTYGAGCKGSNGVPALSNTGLPKLGQSFQVDLGNARANAPALITLGLSDTKFGALVLPFDLTLIGAPSCKLLASPETLIPFATSGTGTASIKFMIPNLSSLNNVSLFNQFMISDPTVNKLTLVFSNGGKMTMGS